MRRRVVVVTGTGTEIGKTHLACALLRRAALEEHACGYKPIESGAPSGLGDDGCALLAASHPMFHVKPPVAPYVFARGVSPHLAARDEGRVIDLAHVAQAVADLARRAELLVVELAGGLFTPLGPRATNADLVRALAPEHVVLVAPDRLGVLHDVGATLGAAGGMGIAPRALALVAPNAPDASTGTNEAELRELTGLAIHLIPRASIDALCRSPSIDAIYACVV